MNINTENYWEALSDLSSDLLRDIEDVLIAQPNRTLDISKANIRIDDNGSNVVSLHLANGDYDVVCTLKNGETYNLYECDIFDILLVAEAINELEE